MSDGMILTQKGRILLAKAITGKSLTFTRAFVGTGDLGNRDPFLLTDLIARKLSLPVTAMRTAQTGIAEVTVEISNKNITSGFFMKEYGLFARDPDDNSEVLYSYCNKGERAGYLEGFDGTNPVNFTLSFITVIDQAQNVTAIIESGYNYVTHTTLDSRLESLFAPSQNPAGFFAFTSNDERRLRPIPLNDTRKSIMGLTDINSLINRVERLEDAINQITLALNVQEIFPGTSHFMAEDFIVPDTIDLYTAQVTSVITGDDSIDCLPIEGLLPGSIYTLTDGAASEYVQVESISYENGIMRVILYDRVKNNYNLPNTRLIRTTADIHSGNAYGSSAMHNITWLPSVTWKGLTASGSFTAALDSSVSNSDAFTFTGNAVINSDGSITLGG